MLIPKIAIPLRDRYLFQGPSFWGPLAVSFRWGSGGWFGMVNSGCKIDFLKVPTH